MVAILVHCFVSFLLLACSSVSRSETDVHSVLLTPMGSVKVCPEERATFTCRTIGGALLWRTTGEATGRVFNDITQASSELGIFRLSVTGVRREGSTVVEVNSTAATLNGVQQEDNNITLTCLIATNFTSEVATLRVPGTPPAPVVTTIIPTQSVTNNLSLLINWTISDCAVQYVVTINSSDGSVYPNITTSDTNTTVTLPNGVEYCVTVAAVDAFDRRGEQSAPSCYDSPPSSTISIVEFTSTTAGTSSPTPSMLPVIDLTVIIIIVSVAAGIIVVAIIVTIALIILCVRKRSKSIQLNQTEMQDLHTCQVFFQNKGKNVWSFTFAISHAQHCHEVEKYYSDRNYYTSCDFPKVTHDVTLTLSNLSDGWKRTNQPFKVSRTAVQQYNCVGEPPHCELIIEAAEKDVTPPDLFFDVDLNGKRITIEKAFEVQNDKECSVQVFYYQVNINWWRVIIAFFPTDQHKQVEQLFQDANTSSKEQLKFCGGNISIITKDAIGWCMSKPDEHEHKQVNTAEIERYNCDCDGKPPYCEFELTLKAVPDDETPPDLSHTVTLFGAKTPQTIILNRVTMISKGVPRPVPPASKGVQSITTGKYACQVFYYKEGINHWRAVFAFFPEEKAERVKEFFQDTNIGPDIPVKFSASAHMPAGFGQSSVKPGLIKSNENGWTVTHSTGKIYRDEIEKYTGEHKPPHFEIIMKSLSDSSIPTDHLSQTIIITGLNPDNNTIALKRALEKTDAVPLESADNSSANVATSNDAENDDQ